MKGIEIKEETELQIDINVTSYIPDEYIKDSSQKIEIYQNIALCKNEQDIQNITDEIIDRFGNMPKEVENLIAIARIKYLAKQIGLSKITSKSIDIGTTIIFTFEQSKTKIDINEIIKKYGTSIKFSNGIKPSITLKTKTKDEKQILSQITKFLCEIGDRHQYHQNDNVGTGTSTTPKN